METHTFFLIDIFGKRAKVDYLLVVRDYVHLRDRGENTFPLQS